MLGVGEHRGDVAAVLAGEAVDRIEPLLDRGQPLGVGVDPVEVGAQLAGDIVELDRQRGEPLADRVELGIDATDPGQQRLGRGDRARGAGLVAIRCPVAPSAAPAAASRRPSAWRSRSRSTPSPSSSSGSGATASISESS